MTDPVNHPAHYTEHPSGIECIQITEHMGFNLGNAVKYIWRADLKGSAIEDLEKARWYIDRELTKRDHIDAEVVGADVPDFAPGGVVIPEGGRVLTAEQVEDVRALVWLDGRRNFDAFYRLRALFPATEPAEDGWGDVNPNDPQGRTYRETAEEYYATPVTERKCCGYCNSTDATLLRSCTNCGAIEDDPWGKTKPAEEPRCTICNLSESEGRHFDYDHPFTTELGPFDDEGNERTTPAPAEPAEEETKADCLYCDLLCGPHEAHKDWTPFPAHFLAPTASSPVVPAPNETGPWERIEDVPEGVLQIKDRHGRTWLMVGGTWRFEWHDGNWHEPHTNINAQAPFVAAAEGS